MIERFRHDRVQWHWAHTAVLLAVALALLASRRPDAFINAQFWAEDGAVWFKEAYAAGWRSLLAPQNGYFQTVSKLTALLSLAFDFAWAPLLFNLTAVFFKLLPIAILNSLRGRQLVPNTACRLFLSFLYLAHPYAGEVHVNVTNIHWHLALAVLLLLYFDDWPGRWRKAGDLLLTALCGLSGTFSLFLAPLALWRWYETKSRRSLVLVRVLSIAALIQLLAIVSSTHARSGAPLGASLPLLVQIFGGQVTLAGLLGSVWEKVYSYPLWQSSVWPSVPASCVGLAVLIRAFVGSIPVLRGLIALAAMIFVAALLSPQISSTSPQWPLFARPHVGERYIFLMIIALHASLLWLALRDPNRLLRTAASTMLALIVAIAIPASWKIRPYADMHFPEHAKRLETAEQGTVIEIPINPPGWSFKLRKKKP